LFVFVPAGVREIKEKTRWFRKPICKKLRGEVEFGFEIKGPTEGLKTSYPYGIHLPNNIASQWRETEQREKLEKEIKNVASLKPLYAVLHGIRASKARTGYKEPASETEKKFISDVGAAEYLRAAEEQISFIKYLQELGIPVVLETVAFTNFSFANGIFLPETYLDLRVGSLNQDMLKIRNETSCRLLVDIEHLALAQNFSQRKYTYAEIPEEIPASISEEEKMVTQEYGLFVRKGLPPVSLKLRSFKDEIKRIGAKIYHLCGTSDGKNYIERKNGKVTSHSPITLEDKGFRKYLNIVLKQKPEILVLEVAGSKDNPCWSDRPENVQETSFENLCKILAEKKEAEHIDIEALVDEKELLGFLY